MALSFKDAKTSVANSALSASKTAVLNSGLATSDTEDNYVLCDDGRYIIYSKYTDDNISEIDGSKSISVHPSQINITQEENSQYIPFKVNRYWDGMDLMDMFIQIHYVNKDGNDDYSNPINVKYNKTFIMFGWLINGNVTALEGDVDFEIIANGSNEHGDTYRWQTKPNGRLNILKSLNGNGIIEPSKDWYTSFVRTMQVMVNEAKDYADQAKASAESIDITNIQDSIEAAVTDKISADISTKFTNYYDKSEIDAKVKGLQDTIAGIDSLSNLAVDYDNMTGLLTLKDTGHDNAVLGSATINSLANLAVQYTVENGKGKLTFYNAEAAITSVEIGSANPSAEWTNAFKEEIQGTIDSSVKKVDDKITILEKTVSEIDLETITSDLSTAKAGIEELKTNVSSVQSTAAEAKNTADILKTQVKANSTAIGGVNDDLAQLEETVKNIGTITTNEYEAAYQDNIFTLLENGEVKNQFTITGGSGGGDSTTITIERITGENFIVLANSEAIIQYKFSSIDTAGDTTGNGTASWRIGNEVVATSTAIQGSNSFDLTPYLKVGTHTVKLSITDSFGSISTKTWSVTVVEFKIESSFNDKLFYSGPTTFQYVPYGSISKEVVFMLNGKELGRETTAVSGRQMSYTIPSQPHGSHLLEVYMVALINGQTIRSESVFKDIIFIDADAALPVIGCAMTSFTAKQYNPVPINYVVYDPQHNPTTIELAIDGDIVSTLTVDRTTQTWSYSSSTVGSHTLSIICGGVVKSLTATIEELGIDAAPVTAGLVFDFNPSGKNNGDPEWLKINDGLSITVSENFDKVNGGYQIDGNGDTYFCVKSGTTATIPHQLFADDARRNGKEFKLIFMTENVRKANSTFLSCENGTTAKIGLQMNTQTAYVTSSNGQLYIPYSEEDVIEFEFNINKDTDIPMVRHYEDGRPGRPMLYDSDSSFTQIEPQNITIGSPDCDVRIYRMKVYSNSLSDTDILTNFIADARTADEMISRYTRNQIYDENNNLDPDVLAEKTPQLRIIKLDCPHFTNNKKDKVLNSTIEYIYRDGDDIYANWKCINAAHSGQGTTSNEYGAAGRNIDLIMNYRGTDDNPNYISQFTYRDGTTGDKIKLTQNSVPVNYLNIKVNIASSENQNNRLLAKRYNDFNPYVRPIRQDNSNIKDTMEFYNCVVFVRENDPDISTHREFDDCDWHFYAIGNIGDSKKTDNTRVDDLTDPKECIVEIGDNTLPNSTFSDSEKALAALEADQFDGDGTYEFRYEMNGITAELRQENIKAWKDFYRFVATSADEEFKANLKDWFVVDSALYFYLFTEYFCMIDNRAKNTFWHYGKCADGVYRWDLCFDYDNDTALGINNTGELTLTYGLEDIDYRTKDDPSSGYVYNAAESVFFRKIRNLFQSELREMYVNRESAGCWNAASIIAEFDKAQNEFPEELVRLDDVRKYVRSYLEGSPRFLSSMAWGFKKYQRRFFLYNQEKYMATKYFGNVAVADQIMFRCNTPIGAAVSPDYTLHLTPYSNMYLSVMFGASYRTQIRAEAGVQYDIECPFATMDDTTVLIYCASFIQSMGDVSACYIHDNDFSKATKLQELKIGNPADGYENNFLTNLVLGNNRLLEKLDIRNTPNLVQVLNVSLCGNLQELYADGSGITGVIFANRGGIALAHLPKISSLNAKNLYNLADFIIEGYENITTLTIENCSAINVLDLINKSPNLHRIRLTGVDWNLGSTDLLDRLAAITGIDENGYNTATSVLAGHVHVPIMREQKLSYYNSIWPDLEISYDTMITQYKLTFRNADDGQTILDIQYVDKGADGVDPVTRQDNPIPVPTLKSTVSTDFTYNGWDDTFTNIFADKTLTAVYTETTREYTVRYASKGTILQETKAPYGTTVYYTGDTPAYTAEEAAYKYNLFRSWDKAGYVDGDKTINAVFDTCEYVDGYFNNRDLSSLSQVEIYTMMKMGLEDSLLSIKDRLDFKLGVDYSYGDILEHEVIATDVKFDGTNHLDTKLSIMDKDRDFTLAIDFEFAGGNTSGATLAQCFQSDGSNGFRLWYSTEPRLSWGTDSLRPSNGITREIIVLRHSAGSDQLVVYNSNMSGNEVTSSALTSIRIPEINSTLVFGCSKADDGIYENHAKGTVHWCKVWYADLGEQQCKDIASWIHETIPMELAKFRGYYLSETASKRANLTFLAKNLLGVNKQYSNKSTNAGGWADSTLNTWLNTRLYKALSPLWKALIKPVKVYSSNGNKSNDTSVSSCYFFVPSLYELDGTASTEPYINETNATIPYMLNDESRKRTRVSTPETNETYWTRSPNATVTNWVYTVNEQGASYGFSYPSYDGSILLMFSIGV